MVEAQLSINPFDAIVLGVLALSCLLSFFRGFIRDFLSLMTWVGAAVATLYLADDVTTMIKPYVHTNTVAAIIATLSTYFACFVMLSILGAIMTRYVKDGHDVGAVDNILGMGFGLLKGSLIIVLGFMTFSQIYSKETYPEWVKTSHALPAVEKASTLFARLLPGYITRVADISKRARIAGEAAKEKAVDGGLEAGVETLSPLVSPPSERTEEDKRLLDSLIQDSDE